MRKFLNTAMESFTPMGTISMEEEDQMIADAAEAAPEIESDLAQADTAQATSDALEDLAVIADGIDEATETEIALINNVAAMGVASDGDVAPAELLGEGEPTQMDSGLAFESYKGRKISTEGIREVARNIWESIKNFLKKIWAKIEKFFYNVMGDVPRLRKSIEAMQKRVDDDSSKKMEDKKVTINSSVANLSENYVPCKTEGALNSALKTFADHASQVFKGHAEKVKKAAEAMADDIADFDPAKPAQSLAKLSASAKPLSDAPSYCKSKNSTRSPGYIVYESPSILGNVVLSHKSKSVDSDKGEDVGFAESLQSASLSMVDSSEKDKSGADSFEMATMSHSGMNEALKTCLKMLDSIEEYSRGKGFKEAKKASDKLRDATSKAEKAFAKLDKDEAEGKAAVPAYRAACNYNKAVTHWSINPVMSFTGHTKSVVRATMMAIQKSMSAYK